MHPSMGSVQQGMRIIKDAEKGRNGDAAKEAVHRGQEAGGSRQREDCGFRIFKKKQPRDRGKEEPGTISNHSGA